MKTLFVFSFIFMMSFALWAAEDDTPAYWEYGVGLGYIHFEHYPGAAQFNDFLLPFPTFQYRGRILRADDRDGAHAYLLKDSRLTLELSGTGYAGLDADKNTARRGMEDLPWLLALGPQLVYKANDDLELSLAVFGAMTTDFKKSQFPGQIYQAKFRYSMEIPAQVSMRGHLLYSVKYASRGLQSLYYETPLYTAKEGIIAQELTYFQSVRLGRTRLYVGFSSNDYSNAANRESPLHLRNQTLTYLAGLTYSLGESSQREIPEPETQGVINRYLRYD